MITWYYIADNGLRRYFGAVMADSASEAEMAAERLARLSGCNGAIQTFLVFRAKYQPLAMR